MAVLRGAAVSRERGTPVPESYLRIPDTILSSVNLRGNALSRTAGVSSDVYRGTSLIRKALHSQRPAWRATSSGCISGRVQRIGVTRGQGCVVPRMSTRGTGLTR